MTAAAAQSLSEQPAESAGSPPAGWQDLRAESDIQFVPVTMPQAPPPPEPGWFAKLLDRLFAWLADLLGPVGEALARSWWWMQWVLAGAAALFAVVLLVRLVDPAWFRRRRDAATTDAADEWQPETAATLALLEDADRLAASGRFDEATRLLLQRSVAQIRAVRPDWVEPSSTARELAALPALPAAARAAFAIMAGRVEASLFALRSLERDDWDAARAAYAEFALARIDPRHASGGLAA